MDANLADGTYKIGSIINSANKNAFLDGLSQNWTKKCNDKRGIIIGMCIILLGSQQSQDIID